jgi:thiol-disulfide isomerase/thioredoxin
MKNYIIALLIVLVIVIISFQYKTNRRGIFSNFPGDDLQPHESIDAPVFLFLFFSLKSCQPCLEIVEVLNNLPSNFRVIGVVPESDLAHKNELKDLSGSRFLLRSLKGYKKYKPFYNPTLIGVSKSKKILFILPGVPKEKEYLENFLDEFSRKAYPILVK